MKIKVRTLRNETFEVDVDPSETVDSLKAKVEVATKQPKAWQKLIFSGKILTDESTVSTYGLKEGDFLVLFSKQPKASDKPAEPEKKDEPKPAVAAPATPSSPSTPAATPATPSTPAATTQAGATGAAESAAASTLVQGDQFEAMVASIMEMGFPREMVIRALNASFRNPDRAVQFLLSGQIPEDVEGGDDGDDAPPSPGGDDGDDVGGHFDFLRNNPQFNALRAVVQANPGALQPILQQLAAANPQILQLIQEHQDEFLRLLQEPVEGNPLEGMGGMGGMGGGAGGAGGMPQAPPGTQYIQVTAAEKEAIDRLCSLGFDRQRVIEAFFACDKNEELAANYLLEGLGMDDDDDFPDN